MGQVGTTGFEDGSAALAPGPAVEVVADWRARMTAGRSLLSAEGDGVGGDGGGGSSAGSVRT